MDKSKKKEIGQIIDHLESTIELLRFSPRFPISEDLKVGFFNTDHATQTDCSEILPLKELSSSTQKLAQIVKSLQVDFGFLKQSLQLKFEDRLQQESFSLFTVLQDRIQSIEKRYQQNEEVIRKCYNQQLADAIAVIKGMYKDSPMTTEISPPKRAVGQRRSLECKQENETLLQTISELKEELQLYIKENSELEDEIISLKEKADKDHLIIQKLINARDRLTYELEFEKSSMQDLVGKQKEDLETRRALDSLILKSQKLSRGEETSWSPMFSVTKMASRGEDISRPASITTPAIFTPIITTPVITTPAITTPAITTPAITSSAITTPAITISAITSPVFIKTKRVRTPKKRLQKQEQQFVKRYVSPVSIHGERSIYLSVPQPEEQNDLKKQIETLKAKLDTEKKKAERLRKESERINKLWERKFYILRNSFHVLKNEMFTRHTLYRQFAMLADTSFNYSKAKPLIVQSKTNLTDTGSSETEYYTTFVDQNYMDIVNEQLYFPPSAKFSVSEVPVLSTEEILHIRGVVCLPGWHLDHRNAKTEPQCIYCLKNSKSFEVQKRNWPQKSERRVNFSLKIRYRLSLQNAGGNFTSDDALISFPMDIQSFMEHIRAVVNCDQCGLLLSRRVELRLPI